jgi:hypothetical protein
MSPAHGSWSACGLAGLVVAGRLIIEACGWKRDLGFVRLDRVSPRCQVSALSAPSGRTNEATAAIA